jgi:hypothetical protein
VGKRSRSDVDVSTVERLKLRDKSFWAMRSPPCLSHRFVPDITKVRLVGTYSTVSTVSDRKPRPLVQAPPNYRSNGLPSRVFRSSANCITEKSGVMERAGLIGFSLFFLTLSYREYSTVTALYNCILYTVYVQYCILSRPATVNAVR